MGKGIDALRGMHKETILSKLLKRECGYYKAILELTEQEHLLLSAKALKLGELGKR